MQFNEVYKIRKEEAAEKSREQSQYSTQSKVLQPSETYQPKINPNSSKIASTLETRKGGGNIQERLYNCHKKQLTQR